MPETNICQYWPKWFREILDFQALCQTEGEELRAMAQAMVQVRQNLFVQTMDEGTTAQWEAIFRIIPNPVTETLDFRRDRVLNRLSLRPPFTLTFLYQRLDSLFGPGNWEVEVDYPNYTLYIEADVADQQYFSEMSVTMDLIKPCHIVYINRIRIASGLVLSEQIDRYKAQFNYILGSWALERLPFATILEEETIKMANQSSIQQALLSQLAGFTAEDVRAVRVNGSIVIAALSRSTEGCLASIRYQVRQEQAAEISKLELLDKDGTVLTSSAVSIPVADETVAFRHTFVVLEQVDEMDAETVLAAITRSWVSAY